MRASHRFAASQKRRPPPENKSEIPKPENLPVDDCIGFLLVAETSVASPALTFRDYQDREIKGTQGVQTISAYLECFELTRPMVRGGTGFDADQARRQFLKERQDIAALEPTPNHYLARDINAVDPEYRLGDIETDCCNRLHVWLI